jgi:hypothetical protein
VGKCVWNYVMVGSFWVKSFEVGEFLVEFAVNHCEFWFLTISIKGSWEKKETDVDASR